MTLGAKDRAEIATLCAAYAALLDAARFEDLSMLFCADGVLHRADGSVVQNRAAILAAQSARPSYVETVHHVAAPFVEPVAPGEARAHSTFLALTKDRRDEASASWTMGTFNDVYHNKGGAWRIARRQVTIADRIVPINKEIQS